MEDQTLLGIDYGERRIGVAKCDPLGIIASALTTLEVKSQRQALDQLARLIDEYQPVGLVVRLSAAHLRGSEREVHRRRPFHRPARGVL